MPDVAIAQMCSSSDVNENLVVVKNLVEQAARNGAEMILLPENFAYMGRNEQDKLSIAETPGEGLIQDFIKTLAIQNNIWIIAGTIPLYSHDINRVFAACMVYNNKGEQCARYDKIHLFDVQVSEAESHRESATIVPGTNVVTVDTPFGCVGLSVCYDLRFAELYRILLKKGAEIFVVPSAFTATTGKAHWQTLLRARAIENLSYVLAANQCGTHFKGRETWGHSMAVDPWGRILAECAETPGIILANINRKEIEQIRKRFPCNEHHVLD